MQQGRHEEARKTLLHILTRRFGAVPEAVEARIGAATVERIEGWIDASLDAPSLAAVFPDEYRGGLCARPGN